MPAKFPINQVKSKLVSNHRLNNRWRTDNSVFDWFEHIDGAISGWLGFSQQTRSFQRFDGYNKSKRVGEQKQNSIEISEASNVVTDPTAIVKGALRQSIRKQKKFYVGTVLEGSQTHQTQSQIGKRRAKS
jgi:hypothetical protein